MTPSPSAPAGPVAAPPRRSGLLFAVGAYGLWGGMPAFFLLLAPAGAFEIVAWRILFTLVFCALLLTVTRSWRRFAAIVRQPRLLFLMGLAGAFIYVNWQVFVFAALHGQVLETSLGYFINPIFTVVLGVAFLREKVRPLQWVAMGFGVIAVLVLAFNYGEFPWISLTLATSFGLYGLIKKLAGARVDAVSGLTLETIWLVPVAVAVLLVVSSTDGIVFGTAGTTHVVIMALSGVITGVPLLLFAAGARRLPLVTMGMIQYLAPVLTFVFGAFILHEAMPPERWAGFSLVWFAIVLLTTDMLVQGRLSRRALPQLG
ncbi:chloramphenicol-sensitive protein RarD [Homoserinimonas aerilata]|uniref:Chloramphenicol-sensitive protein RarD n=1 Tax=Homoserinimonas aerilata TaxID=1162970 RepID=A0A542YLD6_9MICO|nr:EamA family transporter RarD [Homoserinimonas aerilata]TQL48888.1 chloramphenicol-sensitive protein RarD [Homoserinimonas aerilata]